MSNKQQAYINDFFQVFADSAVKTILQNLDKDSCKNVEISIKTSAAAWLCGRSCVECNECREQSNRKC